MARTKKTKSAKAKKSVRGGGRTGAGRKSVEVHFAALHEKLDAMYEVLRVASGAAVAPVAHAASPVVIAPAPVQQVVRAGAPAQPWEVTFVPPVAPQPTAPVENPSYSGPFNHQP